MCGIAGLVFSEPTFVQAELVLSLSRSIEHRGPDDRGYLVLGRDGLHLGRNPIDRAAVRVLLLNRRLSILDLSDAGWQPMGTPDGRYYITFNGEIYNHVELRSELEGQGHRFRSTSDTEVLLKAWAAWGPRVLPRLIGMFAFAVLDTQARTLTLARDFLGIKPLYYSLLNGAFAFGSEPKTLLTVPGVTTRANPHRVYQYLRSNRSDQGGETFFADVRQVPSGHYLRIALDGAADAEPIRYWDVELGDRAELSFEDAAAQFRDLFLASLNMHLQSDVPVGIALSGGLDSSSITGGVRAVMAGGFQIHAFSYLPDDIRISEGEWIDLIGRAAGAVVHKVHLSGKELIADIDHLIEIMGEPFRDTRIYAQYRVFRLAREAGMKVIVDGQGGDELLGGYREFLTARLLRSRRLQSIPKPAPAWLNDAWFLDRGAGIAEAEDDSQDERTLRVLLWRSLAETILPSLLRHGDRNAMYLSLENRVPFLTPDLVKFVLRLPDQYIIGPDRTSKALLRKAMRGIVPDGILDRSTKVPFTTPELQWLKELSPWVDKTLGGTMAHDIPVLRHDRLVREWELRRVGERPYDARVWRWLNLISWAEKVEASFD